MKANFYIHGVCRAVQIQACGPMLLAIMVLLNCGCQFAPTWSQPQWPWSKKNPVVPDRILTVWSDSVLHQPGLTGVRGFGGRVYFYQAPSTEPMEVDGGVAVYVFDADELNPKDQKPVRKYVFTADQLAQHMSKSSLGPSYSLWLPWDEVGGQSRRLSLITRFEGRQGGTVISDPSIKLLPGSPKSTDDGSTSDKSDSNNLRMVGHQQHLREPAVTRDQVIGRGIETIELPPSFQQHLRGSWQSGSSSESVSIPSQANPPWALPTTDASAKPSLSGTAPTLNSNSPATTSLDDRQTGPVTEVHDIRSGRTRSASGQAREIREGKSIQPRS